MNAAEQPEFGIAQIQSMPRFEQVVNPFSLDQRSGKNCAEDWWALPPLRLGPRLETLGIDAPWQVKQFFIGEICRAKRLCCLFRKNHDQRRQFVFFEKSFSPKQETRLPRPDL